MLFYFSSCASPEDEPEDPNSAEQIQDDTVLEYFTEVLEISRSGKNYPNDINEYIISNLKGTGSKYETDSAGNLIVEIPATEGMDDFPLVIMQCFTGDEIIISPSMIFDPDTDPVNIIERKGRIYGTDTSLGASSAFGIATILSVITSEKKHTALRLLFLAGSRDDPKGIKNLPEKKLIGDILISLDGSESERIIIGAPAAASLKSNVSIKSSKLPDERRRAYVIAVSGFQGGRPMLGDEITPDPIHMVTQVLTEALSAGIIYDLASFTGGGNGFDIPQEAEAIVVLGDYEEKQFRRIFNNIRTDWLRLYNINEEDSLYGPDIRMVETELPEKVISNDDSSVVLTHLFTLLTSKMASGEMGNSAVYINDIDLSPLGFTAEAAVYALEEDNLEMLVNEYYELEKITKIPMIKTDSFPGFLTDPNDPQIEGLILAYSDAMGKKPKTSNQAVIAYQGFISAKNESLPIVILGTDIRAKGQLRESIAKKGISTAAKVIAEYIK